MLTDHWIVAFCAILARVAGVFTYFPLPGLKTPVDTARIVLCLAIVVALFPLWTGSTLGDLTPLHILGILIGEGALGLTAGLILGLFFETFQIAAQLFGQQAGFSYASTIDPSNNTDSGVLLVICQLLASWLALAFGLDRAILRELALSFRTMPPGSFEIGVMDLSAVARAGSAAFELGLSIAIPSIGVFLIVDVLMGVLSRLDQQLQLSTVLFPLKTAGSVIVIAATVGAFPPIFQQLLAATIPSIRHLLGG